MNSALEDRKMIEDYRLGSDPRLAKLRAPLPCESGNFFSRIAATASAYERPVEDERIAA